MALKTRPEDLALLGGTPAFAEPVHVGRPNIGDRRRLHERLDRILDSRWLSNDGPFLEEFERRLAALLGVEHCVAVCNATVGLELALRALDAAGEVILPSFTFVATAHAAQWLGLRPVFCDVDPRTHTLDPRCAERLITPRTTAIVGVHLWGNPCAPAALEALAARRGLRLLFDAAHAFGCAHGGRMIGGFGDAEVFSFHATKFVNTFEGGAIATRSAETAARLRLLRNFGFSGYDRVECLGINGKLSEIAAAMGLTSLESMAEIVAHNRRIADAYRREAAGLAGLEFPDWPREEAHNFQYVIAEVDETRFGLSRDALVRVLHAENVLARRYFYPGCHRLEPYRTLDPEAGRRLPVTERLCERVLALPTGTAVSAQDVAVIGSILRAAAAGAAALRRRGA